MAVLPTRAGVDVGATLAKMAFQGEDGSLSFRLVPAADLEVVADEVGRSGAETVGLTGGGASALARLLEARCARVNEFAAWGAGGRILLRRARSEVHEPFLLVSVGTGTSVMLVDGMAVSRVGGTALGGGAVVGLGRALVGSGASFDEICSMARRGRRSQVDLLVSDIYGPGEIALSGDLTAANFGRLAHHAEARPELEDLAAAVMGLVGENVALVCGGLADHARVERIVFAGSTLRGNSALAEVLMAITSRLGRQAMVLEDGEFAGAVGALDLAATPDRRRPGARAAHRTV